MGFLSYNVRFYRGELQKLKDQPVSEASIYRARQLLRMLDDLADEGYTELNDRIEKEMRGVSALREYLRANGAEPFRAVGCRPKVSGLSYSEQEMELNCAAAHAMCKAQKMTAVPAIPFVDRLRRFCQWLGYDEGTAYIFLLRDTLLPFIDYCRQNRERVFPWLLSRQSFAKQTGKQNADDEIRASIYRALEDGCTDAGSFFASVLPDIRKTIAAYPQAEDVLRAMLARIDAKRLIVVESGCAGTFPLLLMSLDARVDMRMYTTYPYLTSVFGDRIFTPRYEENRMFETMASQELLFQFSSIHDGQFYVRTCTDAEVECQSLREIQWMLAEKEG